MSNTATSAIKHAARRSSAVTAKAISHHGHSHAIAPNRIAVLAAIVSIIAKEGLYRVTAAIGKKHNSQVSDYGVLQKYILHTLCMLYYV
jgi:divalent metal cation (Fe/Co/Zn/Cd) transporter